MAATTATNAAGAHTRVLQVLFVGVFMAALDSAVIGPAIPALRAAFGVDNNQIALVTIIFVLFTLTTTALMAGLSDRYGRRPLYLLNIAVFAAGSLTVALAPSFSVLLVGRALQGLGAGGITPTASAVIGDTFPPEQRGKALGLIGATFGMAFLLGPLLASLVMIALSWRWIFLLNLPIALVIFVLGARVLPARRRAGQLPPFDFAGVVLLFILLTSLTLGINQILDTWLGWRVWPWLLLLVLLGVPLFVLVEQRAAQPLVPPHLFANRQLALTFLLTIGSGFGMGSIVFLTSIIVAAFAIPAQQAGLWLIPLVLASSVGSVWFGRLLHTLGSRNVLLIGYTTLASGSALIGLFPRLFWLFLAATLLLGLGVGIVVGGALRYITLNEVPANERATAQGVLSICTNIGTLLGVAVIGAVADRLGSGVGGFATAYLTSAAIALLMGLLCWGLKSRSAEHALFAELAATPAADFGSAGESGGFRAAGPQ